jgi:hypothetical protein
MDREEILSVIRAIADDQGDSAVLGMSLIEGSGASQDLRSYSGTELLRLAGLRPGNAVPVITQIS